MPNVRNLAEDEDTHVRATFAQLLPRLSDIGMSIMEMGQALKAVELSGMQLDLDPGLEVCFRTIIYYSDSLTA